MGTFSKSLNALFAAIGHSGPSPQEIDSDKIISTADVVQDGWAIGRECVFKIDVTDALTQVTVFPWAAVTGAAIAGDEPVRNNVQRLVTGISVLNVSSAAPGNLVVQKRRGGSGTVAMYFGVAPAIGVSTPWTVIGGGAPYWLHETGTELRVVLTGAVAGEDFQVAVMLREVETGMKLI